MPMMYLTPSNQSIDLLFMDLNAYSLSTLFHTLDLEAYNESNYSFLLDLNFFKLSIPYYRTSTSLDLNASEPSKLFVIIEPQCPLGI